MNPANGAKLFRALLTHTAFSEIESYSLKIAVSVRVVRTLGHAILKCYPCVWDQSLERWREAGIAPDQLLASHVTDTRVDMTRPLCPYPQVATYKGAGSTNDAASFACRVK